MTQRYCKIHQSVSANEDGTCPFCNPQHRINLIDPGMKIFKETYQNLGQSDQRSHSNQQISYIPNGYEVKESHQCLDACFICFCCVFLLLPAIFLSLGPFPTESLNIDVARYGFGSLSFIGLLFVLRWWYRVYKAGGITTVEQDQNCNCTGYQYLVESGGCLGICSNVKRLNTSFGCELPRFLCLFVTFVMTFIAGVYFTFYENSDK